MSHALQHMTSSLRSLRAARTQLKHALESRGMPTSALSWDVMERLDSSIVTLARRLREARLARLEQRGTAQ